MTELEGAMVKVISSIQYGQLMTYKEIAIFAGYPNCARQVSRVLKKYSGHLNLCWHRVVGSDYQIKVKNVEIFNIQRQLLIEEGHCVEDDGKIKS